MDNVRSKLELLFKNRNVKYGVPFIVLIVGGSFGLKEFAKLRYEFSKVQTVRQEAKRQGVEMKPPGEVTLESEYEKMKKLDIDNWVQKRVPRPWDEEEEARR